MVKKLLKALAVDRAIYVLFVGSLVWTLVMVRSGTNHDGGVGFWGANGHDGVWHIALTEALARGSLEMPVFAGEEVRNYHIGFDMIMALVHRVSGIPVSVLYFQIIPPIIALSVGFVVLKLMKRLDYSESQRIWGIFFVYFGGSWGWAVTLVREGRAGGESMFWGQQAISTLINPPFALSIVVLLAGLILLDGVIKRGKLQDMYLSVIVFGLLIQIKAYAGVLALGGLGVCGLLRYLREKKKDLLGIFAGSALVSVLVFIPLNREAGGMLVFKPFWFLETMMQLTDRVGWVRYGEAMVNYRSGGAWLKAVAAYTIAFVVFWYGNMGMRFLGEFELARWLRGIRNIFYIRAMILVFVFGGVALPMLVVQSGTAWNTIQFFYYSIFFMAVAAGAGVGRVWDKIRGERARVVLAGGIIVLTVPASSATLKQVYLTKVPPSYLAKEEAEALAFLAEQPRGAVLTYPFDQAAAKEAEATAPRPLYLYTSTAYVSAYGKKPVFLEDEINLDITGFDWRKRKEEVLVFYESLDQNEVRGFLRENEIAYIYWVKTQRARLGETQLGIERIYENSKVDIYKVIR